MSRVYFHSPSGTVELNGSERAYLGHMAERIAQGYITHTTLPILTGMFSKPLYGQADPQLYHVQTWWAVGDHDSDNTGTYLTWHGHRLSPWDISLNTALLLGSEHVQLAARIHAQCEIHGWVDGPNRAWLADLMQSGVDRGIYRGSLTFDDPILKGPVTHSQGWEEVIAFLRERDDEPVVMSYSVCEQFPNPDVAEWEPADDSDEARDAWYRLAKEEQWRLGMLGLTADRGGPQLKPEHFGAQAKYHFTDGVTMLDLLSGDRDERLARLFGDVPTPA